MPPKKELSELEALRAEARDYYGLSPKDYEALSEDELSALLDRLQEEEDNSYDEDLDGDDYDDDFDEEYE